MSPPLPPLRLCHPSTTPLRLHQLPHHRPLLFPSHLALLGVPPARAASLRKVPSHSRRRLRLRLCLPYRPLQRPRLRRAMLRQRPPPKAHVPAQGHAEAARPSARGARPAKAPSLMSTSNSWPATRTQRESGRPSRSKSTTPFSPKRPPLWRTRPMRKLRALQRAGRKAVRRRTRGRESAPRWTILSSRPTGTRPWLLQRPVGRTFHPCPPSRRRRRRRGLLVGPQGRSPPRARRRCTLATAVLSRPLLLHYLSILYPFLTILINMKFLPTPSLRPTFQQCEHQWCSHDLPFYLSGFLISFRTLPPCSRARSSLLSPASSHTPCIPYPTSPLRARGAVPPTAFTPLHSSASMRGPGIHTDPRVSISPPPTLPPEHIALDTPVPRPFHVSRARLDCTTTAISRTHAKACTQDFTHGTYHCMCTYPRILISHIPYLRTLPPPLEFVSALETPSSCLPHVLCIPLYFAMYPATPRVTLNVLLGLSLGLGLLEWMYRPCVSDGASRIQQCIRFFDFV
ncbi:hypothetical protein BD413DRAFT_512064, partial [Trametes elegans]